MKFLPTMGSEDDNFHGLWNSWNNALQGPNVESDPLLCVEGMERIPHAGRTTLQWEEVEEYYRELSVERA